MMKRKGSMEKQVCDEVRVQAYRSITKQYQQKASSLWTLGVVALLAMAMGVSSCRGKERPVEPPVPTPTPTPTPKQEGYTFQFSHKGIIKDGRFIEGNTQQLTSGQTTSGQGNPTTAPWQVGNVVSLWGYPKGENKSIELSVRYGEGRQWLLQGTLPKQWSAVQQALVGYLPYARYDVSTDQLIPTMAVNEAIGAFQLSHYYRDLLQSKVAVEEGKKSLSATLVSPFRQVELILKNGKSSQLIKGITIAIEGVLANAHYHDGEWSGEPTTLKIQYKDKGQRWKANEADTLCLALPTNETSLKVTITYQGEMDKETQTMERQLSPREGTLTPLLFSFPTLEINNPPLAFTLPIDVNYWREANAKAMALLNANRGEDYTEEAARELDWVNIRPLTDELMHSRILYKDDSNIIGWRTELKEPLEMVGRDFGLMFGLETMDGQLVEVYPPLYFSEVAGYSVKLNLADLGYYDNYCYVTAPAGKYRLVCFFKWHKGYVGEEMSRKWHKLPLLDSYTPFECLDNYSGNPRDLYKPVPMGKSLYKGIEEVEVVDRVADNNTAPRWRMGMTYNNKEDFKNNRPSYLGGTPTRSIAKGAILQAIMVNTSNQELRGTIVARCEYQPMFNPVGFWKIEEMNENYKRNGINDIATNLISWNHEVGRTEITLTPNSETTAQVEMINYNAMWTYKGNRDTSLVGPSEFIHFYWVDEQGREELMMRVDYNYLNNAQRDNFGDPTTNHNANYQENKWWRNIDWKEYKVDHGPADGKGVPNANGFIPFS